MGEITEALRANLRELALSDARLMREMEAGSAPGAAPQLDDGLDRMALKELRALGKERGFKGLTRHKKDELIALLRGGEPTPAAAPSRALKASAPSLTALEERLERMEGLLQRIAARLEVS